MKNVIPLLFKSGGVYFEKNKELLETQLEYLEKVNNSCLAEYQQIAEEAAAAKVESEATSAEMKKVTDFCSKIDNVSASINEMEAQADALEAYMTKLENKFTELETIKKYSSLIKKGV